MSQEYVEAFERAAAAWGRRDLDGVLAELDPEGRNSMPRRAGSTARTVELSESFRELVGEELKETVRIRAGVDERQVVEAGVGELLCDLDVAVGIGSAGERLADVIRVDPRGGGLEVDRVGQFREPLPAEQAEAEHRVSRLRGDFLVGGPCERHL